MADDRLIQSKAPGGAHYLLAKLIGNWEGKTRTWFEPEKLADESVWKGRIRSILEGRFLLHEYEGSLQGKPLAGAVLCGFHLQKNLFQTAWVDGFHMGTGVMYSEGRGTEKGFSVLGQYDDPGGGPPWGWRTEVELDGPDQLVITAYNITPQGMEARAVETRYTRKK